MDATSRRRFLELAGLGAAAAAIGPRPAQAQGKSLTFLHESSFIKTFDEYFQKTLAPAYQKETGVKVNYELTSVGSLPTRVSTISETGSGADVTMMFFLLPFLFDETGRAVDFARKFFRDTMLDDVLGWTDVSNNKAWYAEQISCTNNAESILWLAKRDFPDIAKVTDQAMNPAGPKGRFHIMSAISHGIFNFSPQKEEARAFLRWLTDEKQLGGWYASADTYCQLMRHRYDKAPMWDVEPRNIPYRDALANAHLLGWPAPPSRHLAESIAKYVIVDMFAKACAGASTKEVIKNAEVQLKEIYRTA